MNFAIQKAGDNDKWVDMITKERITWIQIVMQPNKNGLISMFVDDNKKKKVNSNKKPRKY